MTYECAISAYSWIIQDCRWFAGIETQLLSAALVPVRRDPENCGSIGADPAMICARRISASFSFDRDEDYFHQARSPAVDPDSGLSVCGCLRVARNQPNETGGQYFYLPASGDTHFYNQWALRICTGNGPTTMHFMDCRFMPTFSPASIRYVAIAHSFPDFSKPVWMGNRGPTL